MTDLQAPARPSRGAAAAWAGPVLALVPVAAATAVVALLSPEEPGNYPTCPFHAVTGWWCPGCGSLRAVHALTSGDVATAVDRNVLLVLAVPVLVLAWAAWVRRTVTGRSRRPVPAAAGWTLLVTGLAFWVLRNVPAGSWLAP